MKEQDYCVTGNIIPKALLCYMESICSLGMSIPVPPPYTLYFAEGKHVTEWWQCILLF